MTIDLSTKQAKEALISKFKNLMVDPGWIIYEQMVRENIETVKNEILDGDPNQTIEDIKTQRKILALYTGMIEIPTRMIAKLSIDTTVNDQSDDPYDTTETMLV